MTNNYHSPRLLRIIIICLFVVFAVLIVLLVAGYHNFRRTSLVNAREAWLSLFVARQGHPTQSDIAFLRSWMTFDYINHLFRLPPGYLAGKLSISDSHYPRLTISSYITHNHLDGAMVMRELEDALRASFTPSATSSAM